MKSRLEIAKIIRDEMTTFNIVPDNTRARGKITESNATAWARLADALERGELTADWERLPIEYQVTQVVGLMHNHSIIAKTLYREFVK
jgi:hypothetical protein